MASHDDYSPTISIVFGSLQAKKEASYYPPPSQVALMCFSKHAQHKISIVSCPDIQNTCDEENE